MCGGLNQKVGGAFYDPGREAIFNKRGYHPAPLNTIAQGTGADAAAGRGEYALPLGWSTPSTPGATPRPTTPGVPPMTQRPVSGMGGALPYPV